MLMRIKLLKRYLFPAVLCGLAVFSISSCKPSGPTPPTENVFLAPDLYLRSNWEAEQRLEEALLTQLETEAGNQAVEGKMLAARLAQYRTDKGRLHNMNKKLLDEYKNFFEMKGLVYNVGKGVPLPPPPPPPPPPIIEDPTKIPDIFSMEIKSGKPLTILFAPSAGDNVKVRLFQGENVVEGRASTSEDNGATYVELNINDLKPGPAVLQLPGFDRQPPLNIGVQIAR